MKKLFFVIACFAMLAFTAVDQVIPQQSQVSASMVPALKDPTGLKTLFTDPRCNCIGCSTDANGVRYCCYDAGGIIYCAPE